MINPYRQQILDYAQSAPGLSMTGQRIPDDINPGSVKSTMGVAKPDGFNPYAAGGKQYGAAGTSSPNSGPVSSTGMEGYRNREQKAAVARQASLNMLKAAQSGKYASSEWLGGQLQNGRA